MAIESSTTSALAEVAPDLDDREPTAEGEEEQALVDPHVPAAKTTAKTLKAALVEQIDDINLARYIDQDELDRIGDLVVREYRIDALSRSEWADKSKKAMKFATQEAKTKSFPWPKASNIIFPLIAQASLDFAARTYPAIVQNRNVVKGVVWGSDDGTPMTDGGKPDGQPRMLPSAVPNGPPQPVWLVAPGEKRKRADRIGEHMSWQLLVEMPEWEPQTDSLLHQIPIVGGAARKTFRDPVKNRNCSLFVSLMNLVWNYKAPSFEAAPRHTEKVLLYPNEITEMERLVGAGDDPDGEGMFLPLQYGPGGNTDGDGFDFNEDESSGDQGDDDAPHLFIEQHRRLDLDDDGYEEPYIVTVHLRSGKTVRIKARYDADGIKASKSGRTIYSIEPVEHYTLYPFFPSLDGGSYPMGFGHILQPLNRAINTTLNQMFDAGTLQNSGGGFISDQLGLPSGQSLFSVGKYTRVTSKGQSIRDSVFPIPFQGPSPVLFQLLGVLLTAGKDLAGIGNILAGDAAMANAPPTTILALIEQGMKLYTAITKRVYRAEKSELEKLYRLNRLHIKDKANYQIGDESREITAEDYRLGGGVEPIADPTMTTDMQKLGRAQIGMQFKDDPLINQVEIRRRLFEAASMDRIDDLFAKPMPPDPAMLAMQQMEMALKQAELGKTRAEELKNQTQAFLNMALARKNASAQEEAFIEAQLSYLRLKIEAVNATTRAAQVDHAHHDTNVRAGTAAAKLMADRLPPVQSGEEPAFTPGPTGPFPLAPNAPSGRAVASPASPASAVQGGAPDDALPIPAEADQ